MDSQRPMGPVELERVGRALWPHHWIARMGEALGVGRRAIGHYLTGHRRVPASAPARLERAAWAEIVRLQGAVDHLRDLQGLDAIQWGETDAADYVAPPDMGEPEL